MDSRDIANELYYCSRLLNKTELTLFDHFMDSIAPGIQESFDPTQGKGRDCGERKRWLSNYRSERI